MPIQLKINVHFYPNKKFWREIHQTLVAVPNYLNYTQFLFLAFIPVLQKSAIMNGYCLSIKKMLSIFKLYDKENAPNVQQKIGKKRSCSLQWQRIICVLPLRDIVLSCHLEMIINNNHSYNEAVSECYNGKPE